MDFGVVGLDNGCSISVTETNNMEKWYGSGGNKQERSGMTTTACEDDWRGLKVAKTVSDDYLSAASKSMPTTSLLRSEQGQQMLSFSSPNSQTFTATTLPCYNYPSSSSISYTTRNPAGYGNGGLLISGARGPFTPSQWMELEHQALIYKYINANVPIPSYLLTPIRKALDAAGFSAFTSLRSNSFGWGGFHLGFSNSNDPEPGRCRRTDGKKWRCSRDAIADHKYCERHMNRGRHRSRKPVEGGQSGHSVSGTTNNTNTVKLTSSSAAVVPGGGASNNPGLSSHHQLSNLQKIATSQSSTPPQGDRNLVDKEKLGERYHDTAGLSILSPAISMKESDYSIPNPKQQNPYAESSRGEFGQVCSDSLLNPLNRSSSFINCSTYGTSEDINDRESKSQHGLRQFMDDWPNSRTERSWPDIEMHSERTQLSISIPIAASDFMSSTSSPTNDKIATSPLRLSWELEMGLGVGNIANERNQRRANWIPNSWESSALGGPLGEVLHSTNNSNRDGKNESALNLMSEGCPSPRLASSPTGVLQKSALVSLSNNSAGCSPRAVDNSRMIEGSSFCSSIFGSTLMNPALNAL